MGADIRAFQEILRHNCISVHCNSFEFTFCDFSGRQICWQMFCKKKKKKGIDPAKCCAQTKLSIDDYTCT